MLAEETRSIMARNCWQIIGCGREPKGFNVDKYGVCPASTDRKSDGINSGVNAGRYCWKVSGTLCGGEAQGIETKNMVSCTICRFYLHVKSQEGADFHE